MIYELKCLEEGTNVMLFHERQYNKKEFEKIISNVRFELGHYIHIGDIVKILCSKYGFKQIISAHI
ncbi:TPA: hypothetical protein ACTZ34_000395 [Bacillus cereus]